MSENLVLFNIRYEKSSFELKIKTPVNVSGFIETLKNELKLEDIDDLVILCPTSEGKMMEITSDDDIEFLKKTKLCFNAVSKEIYCSVELVVIIIPKEQLDDKVQIKILANKVEQLASKIEVLSLSLNNKIEENTSEILESIRLIMSDRSPTDSCSSPKKHFLGEPSSPNMCKSEPKPGFRQKKPKKDKERVTTLNDENSANSSENTIQPNINVAKDIDTLLGMLANEGFTNTIQNIIVLKRFDNDFDKAITYLKSSTT